MLAAAWLAFNLYLPTEDPGRSRLPASERDQVWARRLFEAAVVGFYDTLLSPRGWTIKPGKKIDWQIERPTPGMEAILPSMKTDIVLDGPAPQGSEIRSRTIIDTKFTHILSTGQFGDATLRSGYIYQMYAYPAVTGTRGRPPVDERLGGCYFIHRWTGTSTKQRPYRDTGFVSLLLTWQRTAYSSEAACSCWQTRTCRCLDQEVPPTSGLAEVAGCRFT